MIFPRSLPIFFFFFLLTFFESGQAQVSQDIPLREDVYDRLDLLRGGGMLRRSIRGQRPYSRGEFQRQIEEAKGHFTKEEDSPFLHEVLRALEKSFEKEEKWKWVDTVKVESSFLESQARNIPSSGGQEFIDASVDPLVKGRDGISYGRGGKIYLQTTHWIAPQPQILFYVSPLFPLSLSHSGDVHSAAYLQEGYIKTGIRNMEIGLGRQAIHWGQSRGGGLSFSNNARPIDMIRIKNISPVKIPIFGDFAGTFYLGMLGPEQHFPHSQISGFKISLRPVSWIEVGFGNQMIFGGRGSPSFSFGEGLQEWFGFIPGINQTSKDFSNRVEFFDLNLQFPFLRNSEFYAEAAFDDSTLSSWRGIEKTLFDDSGYIFGLWVPRISSDGKWQGRLEYKRLAERLYRHATFQSGFTLNRKILGDPLGPDSHSISLGVSQWVNVRNRFDYQLSFEGYETNLYMFRGDQVELTQDGPQEERWRTKVVWHRDLSSDWATILEGAYEYVGAKNNLFLAGTLTRKF